jgi:PAS domain S-box-containing protein
MHVDKRPSPSGPAITAGDGERADYSQNWRRSIGNYLTELMTCRLCRSIALWVLLSILLVEGAILFPSYRNYERDLLLRLRDVGDAVASAAVGSAENLSGPALRDAGLRILQHDRVVGASIHTTDGGPPLRFGEVSELTPGGGGDTFRSADGRRYAILANTGSTATVRAIVVNLDSSWISGELVAFVFRITGLVLLITAITVMATMAVLGRFVLRPLLHLRARLDAAALEPEHPEKFAARPRRKDEVGDLFVHFNNMIRTVSSAHREARERLAMMVENSQNAVFAFSPDGRAEYLNKAALQLCDVDHLDLLRASDIPQVELRGHRTQSLDEYLRRADSASEPTLVRRSGQRISCSLRKDRLRNERGETILDYAFVLDITAQKKAQAALSDSEARFRTIFEQSVDPIVLADKEFGTIVDFNAATCRVLEYDRDELQGENLSRLLGDDAKPLPTGDGHPRYIGPVARTTGKGRDIEVEASVAEIDIDGRPHYLAHITDATKRRQTERALRKAKEEADAVSRGKSAFLAAMSHELRTPLNAIIGFASILRSEIIDSRETEQQREYAGLIEDSGQHLLRIVKQVMDLSQLESNAVEVNEELIELNDLFCRAVRASASLRGDGKLLGQILTNLLSNARKFTDEDGTITLSARETASPDPS